MVNPAWPIPYLTCEPSCDNFIFSSDCLLLRGASLFPSNHAQLNLLTGREGRQAAQCLCFWPVRRPNDGGRSLRMLNRVARLSHSCPCAFRLTLKKESREGSKTGSRQRRRAFVNISSNKPPDLPNSRIPLIFSIVLLEYDGFVEAGAFVLS